MSKELLEVLKGMDIKEKEVLENDNQDNIILAIETLTEKNYGALFVIHQSSSSYGGGHVVSVELTENSEPLFTILEDEYDETHYKDMIMYLIEAALNKEHKYDIRYIAPNLKLLLSPVADKIGTFKLSTGDVDADRAIYQAWLDELNGDK